MTRSLAPTAIALRATESRDHGAKLVSGCGTDHGGGQHLPGTEILRDLSMADSGARPPAGPAPIALRSSSRFHHNVSAWRARERWPTTSAQALASPDPWIRATSVAAAAPPPGELPPGGDEFSVGPILQPPSPACEAVGGRRVGLASVLRDRRGAAGVLTRRHLQARPEQLTRAAPAARRQTARSGIEGR